MRTSRPVIWTLLTLLPLICSAGDFTVFPCNATECSVGQVVTDQDRNTYVVGTRSSGAPSGSEVFVAKLDPAGATIFLATFGGDRDESGRAIAVDPARNIFVGGWTASPNFPLRNARQTTRSAGAGTGFLIKLSPDGQIVYSTFFGGMADSSSVSALAVDTVGNLYVTGQTGASDFTTTAGMPAFRVTGNVLSGVFGTFVAKLDPSGDRVLYSGIIAGSSKGCSGGSSCFLSTRSTSSASITLDSESNCYILGNTEVTDLPTTQGVMVPKGTGAWIARVNASGAKLDYLTYLGAKNNNTAGAFVDPATVAADLAVDELGYAYITGRTNDPEFPVTMRAFQIVLNGPSKIRTETDAFIAKLNLQGSAMVYASYLGGARYDAAHDISIDSLGFAYVTGETLSSNFPTATNGLKGRGFVAMVNPTGTALSFSSRYPDGFATSTLAPDADGRVRTGGPTGIVSSFPLRLMQTHIFGVANAARGPVGAGVSPGEVISIYGTQFASVVSEVGIPDASGRMPTTLAGTQVLFDGIAAPLL